MSKLLTISQASLFATEFVGKNVTESNISYLIQYGRIDKFENNGLISVDQEQLENYYKSFNGQKESVWKDKLGDDVNWKLSFDGYKEAETTKHVHRLHPYKGKFIPQLVEYFLDSHTDAYKTQQFFSPGDIVLDPFCGSGTTLVQANELGIHAIGVDISAYNAQISNTKIASYDFDLLNKITNYITNSLEEFEQTLKISNFEQELLNELYNFNTIYFPSPEYKKKVYRKEIDEKEYGKEKEQLFLPVFYSLSDKYGISLKTSNESFLDTWYFETVRKEIHFVNEIIDRVTDETIKNLLQVILSRTMRSCRATKHSDLATLLQPVYTTYYCTKHKKICKPLFSILKWWKTYSKDTLSRLEQFNSLKTDTFQHCFTGDSSSINITECIRSIGGSIEKEFLKNRIKGIFCSPPYVGLIDYHEQHAYAYELFRLERQDDLEIGSMQKGHTKTAQQKYVEDISAVLNNCKKYLADDYEVFIVANDKFGLYEKIAYNAGMTIVDQFKRPVLNRTEKDKNAYSETIFRMKGRRSMTNETKQAIAKVIIKVLKSRFDTFPEDATEPRNAPFHKAFLKAFSEKFDEAGTNVDAMISMSSWIHGLNTTLGQSFFEGVAHILCNGDKRSFDGADFKIYSNQEYVISEIMTDLKNGDKIPNVQQEDELIAEKASGDLVKGTNFTVDCFIENETDIVAIELKSVRPNSGEMRGEKQKILKAKAALRIKYPNKNIRYIFGFPFDPTADSDTEYNKQRFMSNIIEFSKFCDENEILLSDELWSYLSGEKNTMQELLDLIRTIATSDFINKFEYLNDLDNLLTNKDEYIQVASEWCLFDEVNIAKHADEILKTNPKKITSALFSRVFSEDGRYNERRKEVLNNAIRSKS